MIFKPPDWDIRYKERHSLFFTFQISTLLTILNNRQNNQKSRLTEGGQLHVCYLQLLLFFSFFFFIPSSLLLQKETISILSPNEFITEICAPSRVSPGGPGNFSRCSANDSQILSTFPTPNPAAKTLVTIPPCLSLPSWNPQILLAL